MSGKIVRSVLEELAVNVQRRTICEIGYAPDIAQAETAIREAICSELEVLRKQETIEFDGKLVHAKKELVLNVDCYNQAIEDAQRVIRGK